MVDIVKEESSRQSIPLGYTKHTDPLLGDYFTPVVDAGFGTGNPGNGGTAVDREIVLSQYRVKSAFTDAAVGDTISAIRVLDLTTNPASQWGVTLWYNETQQKALTAPASANLEPMATGGGITNAQFIAAIVGLATAAKQDTANGSLTSIDGKLPPLAGNRLPVDLPVGLATAAGQVTAAQLLDAIGQLLSAINSKTPAAGTAQPVSGTFFQATQPVSGPLTDAQLRAAAVAVSGTFYQATQPVSGPLTDAQLRAAAVPVSGPLTDVQLRAGALAVTGTFYQATQPVSGPLTDAQLRAGAVAMSAAALPLPAGASTSALQTAGNTSLSTLATNLPAKGTAASSGSMPITPASDALFPTNNLAMPTVARVIPVAIKGGASASVTLTPTCRRVSMVAVATSQRYLVGTGTVNALPTSHLIMAGERLDMTVPLNGVIAAISDTSATGSLEISELS